MKILPAIMFASLSPIWAQGDAGLHARELFYTPVPEIVQPQSSPPANDKAADSKPADNKKAPPKKTPPPAPKSTVAVTPGGQSSVAITVAAPAALGLRYSVLKRDAAGAYVEVNPDATFESGDRIRLEVKSNTTGYLYIYSEGASGRKGQWLFPSKEIAGGSNLIQRNQPFVVPPDGQWKFDEHAGVEKLAIFLSRQPVADLDRLISSAPPDTDDVVDRLRRQMAGRDLIFEKVEADTEKAAYVVNPSPAPDARVAVDVALKHK